MDPRIKVCEAAAQRLGAITQSSPTDPYMAVVTVAEIPYLLTIKPLERDFESCAQAEIACGCTLTWKEHFYRWDGFDPKHGIHLATVVKP
jgi:hypothetical protein